MSTAHIPGSYPESVPPTPEQTMQQLEHPQPVQSAQHSRQRNKLHKSSDPRGHGYTDSGVGITDQEPNYSSPADSHYWTGPAEAVGGGTYASDDTRPLESIRSELNTESPSREAEYNAQRRSNRDIERTPVALGAAGDAAGGMSRLDEPDNAKSMTQDQQTSNNAPPYWGSLPKPEGGGVYNTVMGHGSSNDDHSEHHHLPKRPEEASESSERARIAQIGNYPRGSGIYNTVTGNGSRVEESKRHSEDPYAAAAASGLPDTSFVDDPLPDIPEETQRSRAGNSGVAPGLLPETAVRDDVLLAANASQDTRRKPSPPSEILAPHPSASPRRAFPLGASDSESHDSRRTSESADRHGALAGAAGLGAGVAASEVVGKRKKGSSVTNSPPTDQGTRHFRNFSEDNQAIGAVTTGSLSRDDTQRSPVEKTRSHGDDSTKGEKKHKILGIFHRHKDDTNKEDISTRGRRRESSGSRAEPVNADTGVVRQVSTPGRLRKNSRSSRTDKTSPAPTAAASEDHSGHGKEKAATGAAVGVGTFGLLHNRRKSQEVGSADGRGDLLGSQQQAQALQDPAFTNSRHLAAHSGGAGPAGQALPQVEEVSTPFEHPREPPMPPPHTTQAGAEPGMYGLMASGIPSHTKQNPTKSPQSSRRDNDAIVSEQPGDFNVLTSSGASPAVQHSSPQSLTRSHESVTQQPGDYNVLPSGIPSGVKHDSPASSTGNVANTRAPASKGGNDTATYNILPSGTASGVKIQPKEREPRRTSPVTHADNQDGHGKYNTLHSGTASGLNPDARSSPGSGNITARSQDLNDLPVPNPTQSNSSTSGMQQPMYHSSQHASMLAAPVAVHAANSLRQQLERPNPSQESGSGVTPYPNPEMVHNMSPEVMPAAYTASAPGHSVNSSLQQQRGLPNQSQESAPGITPYPNAEMVHNMSPEVMPAAYTTSAPRHSGATPNPSTAGHSLQQQRELPNPSQGVTGYPNPEMVHHMSPEVMPDAYTASAPGHSGATANRSTATNTVGQDAYSAPLPAFGGQRQREEFGRGRDPALAAATASWAGSSAGGAGAGTGAGVGGFGSVKQGMGRALGKVTHRCEHCGGENDISGYFGQGQGQERADAGLWQGQRL